MTVGILGRRYAGALLNLATEAGNIEKVAADLQAFAASWKDSRDLRAAFENPSVNVATRRVILREIAQASGMDPLVRNALLLIADRGRLGSLPEIVESFQALAEERSGRVRAEVVTATELPDAFFSELQKTLERVTGKQVNITRKVDPSIIGGVVTRIADQVYDGSVKHRLQQLRDELNR